MGEDEKIPCMSVQADLSKGTSQRVTEFVDILQKINLSGINKWDSHMQQEAQGLMHEYACIFPKMI